MLFFFFLFVFFFFFFFCGFSWRLANKKMVYYRHLPGWDIDQ